MVHPDFEIDVDESRGLIEFRLAGHWRMETVARFRVGLANAYDRLARKGHASGSLLILADCRAHGVQPQDIMAALADLAQELTTVAKRTAVVVAGMLHKMQVERVSPDDRIRTFSDYEEATAWLSA